MSLPPSSRGSDVHRLRRRLRPRRRARFKGLSFNHLIPNILTLIGLCSGLTSIRFALDGKFAAAVVAIVLAAVIDGLDGRIARLLKGTSRFGAEFDSLADFLCFGVAPPLVLYLWSLQALRGYGFAPCLLFTVCMGLRLARFNAMDGAMADNAPGPAYAYNFFTGVPAPAGAGVALFPLLVGLEAQTQGWDRLYAIVSYPAFAAAVLVGMALLSISTLPVWSFKNFKIPSQYVLPTLLGVGLYVALLFADPWAALIVAALIYLGMLPFGVRSFRRLRIEAEQDRDDPAGQPLAREHPAA